MTAHGETKLGIDFYLIRGVTCWELKLACEEMGDGVDV